MFAVKTTSRTTEFFVTGAAMNKETAQAWADHSNKVSGEFYSEVVEVCPDCRLPFDQHKPCGSFVRTDAAREREGNADALRVTRQNWTDFDGVDCPTWATEDQANAFCSFLNAYIPKEHGQCGCRYHVLNHYNGGLYFHLLNRPVREVL